VAHSRFSDFRKVWLIDFEFGGPPGGRPEVRCIVAREWRSGRVLRIWADELRSRRAAPIPTGPDVLVVAYYASAEMACFLALGWPMPACLLDLFAEFRVLTNGRPLEHGNSLLAALFYFGLDGINAAEKEEMRQLALRGGDYTAVERDALLDYCESDVTALAKLLPRMVDRIDLHCALNRGRYMRAAGLMEHLGVPIDVPTLARLRESWDGIRRSLIAGVDEQFGVYEGTTFKADRFAAYLGRTGTPWPRREDGRLALDEDTFRDRSRYRADLALLHELRSSLSNLRLRELTVGPDGRNRTLLSAFRARTGRNQPSNSKFIFGPARWYRGLIKPAPGRALAYIDFEQQEFAIAASLSGDPAMQEAYLSGDCYMAFAIQSNLAPRNATKKTHKEVRNRCKQCILGVQYGMGADSLAHRLGLCRAEAQLLLDLHRRTYPRYWRWADSAVDHAVLNRRIETVFGWPLHVPDGSIPNPRSLRNFPCQANGAEMLRLACARMAERDVPVVAPVHDAVVVEGPEQFIDQIVAEARACMGQASCDVLDGFGVRTDVGPVWWDGHDGVVRPGGRYMDEDGLAFWNRVMGLVGLPQFRDGHDISDVGRPLSSDDD
jgi:hypothetical protein